MDKSLLVNGELHLYGDVGDPFGWGDGFTPADVAMSLAEHGDGDVTARINSGGGIASDGMAIYSLLKAHPGKVTMVVDGVAASAASLIVMAGDTRQMRDGAMMMIHDPATVTFGNAAAHERSRAFLEKLADNYAGVYARAADKPAPEVRSMMKAETWLTADDAISNGFAHGKLDDAAQAKASFDYAVYMRAPQDLPVRKRKQADPMAQATSRIAALARGVAARMRMRRAAAEAE